MENLPCTLQGISQSTPFTTNKNLFIKQREMMETEEQLSDSQLATLNTALDKLEQKRLVLLDCAQARV